MTDRFKYLITVFFLLTVSELFFASAQIELEPIGNYQNGVFDKSKDGVYNHWPCPGRGWVKEEPKWDKGRFDKYAKERKWSRCYSNHRYREGSKVPFSISDKAVVLACRQ